MPFESVITIDVDDAKFKAFEDKYDAFAKALKQAHPRLDLGTDATLAGLDAILQQVTRIASAIDRATFAQQRFRSATTDTARAMERSRIPPAQSSGFRTLNNALPGPLRTPTMMAAHGLGRADEFLTGGLLAKLASPIGLVAGGLVALTASAVGAAEMLGRLARSGLDLFGRAQSLGMRPSSLQAFEAATTGLPTNLSGIVNAQHNMPRWVALSLLSGMAPGAASTASPTTVNLRVMERLRAYMLATRGNPAAQSMQAPELQMATQLGYSLPMLLQLENLAPGELPGAAKNFAKFGTLTRKTGVDSLTTIMDAQKAAATQMLAHIRLLDTAMHALMPDALKAANLENAAAGGAAKALTKIVGAANWAARELERLAGDIGAILDKFGGPARIIQKINPIPTLRNSLSDAMTDAAHGLHAAEHLGASIVHRFGAGMFEKVLPSVTAKQRLQISARASAASLLAGSHLAGMTRSQQLAHLWLLGAAADAQSGLPAGTAFAIGAAESGNNPFAVSPRGNSVGITQLERETAREHGVLHRFNPAASYQGSDDLVKTSLLSLREHFPHLDPKLALALAMGGHNLGARGILRSVSSHRTLGGIVDSWKYATQRDVLSFEKALPADERSEVIIQLLEKLVQQGEHQHRITVNPHTLTVHTSASADARTELQANAAGR